MATADVSVGQHTFRISTIPVVDGGWTITIVHQHDKGDSFVETRHDSDVVYETEEQALEQGSVVARQMAARHAV
ncbi:hypothetical protein OKW30_001373 [Paraburkholderia sp. Clong3]|uniref:hypothetical protein n=1 Tax=Paraburkholderia sp. Clong3 TaxID=2991061 RepID=UPI003D1D918E